MKADKRQKEEGRRQNSEPDRDARSTLPAGSGKMSHMVTPQRLIVVAVLTACGGIFGWIVGTITAFVIYPNAPFKGIESHTHRSEAIVIIQSFKIIGAVGIVAAAEVIRARRRSKP